MLLSFYHLPTTSFSHRLQPAQLFSTHVAIAEALVATLGTHFDQLEGFSGSKPTICEVQVVSQSGRSCALSDDINITGNDRGDILSGFPSCDIEAPTIRTLMNRVTSRSDWYHVTKQHGSDRKRGI